MSSPSSPEPQKIIEHTYQSGDDPQVLLTACPCHESSADTVIIKPGHHHSLLTLSGHLPATANVMHGSAAAAAAVKCTCYLRTEEIVAETEEAERKCNNEDRIEVSNVPPALPPRPPPRPRTDGSLGSRGRLRRSNPHHGGIRKYVFWCCVCGGLATILGALFLVVYFLLRAYTSTLGYFETIPTFVPATMLILTGLCVMSLARRKNRYSYLIKVCGLCCLVCALTCVLVTITTTVIHMNRLQTLRECVYTQKTRTCTCYSVLLESHSHADDGMRFIFDSTPDCEVIHGALYSCLRAMFGLSVSGILVCIFSCMLVYQLLSHEKKKMYWEQLELRCRSFYQSGTSGPNPSNHGSVRGPPAPSSTYCSCCEECRYPSLIGPQVYPWDAHPATERFWTPGRVGNFYSPNPGEEGIDPASRAPPTGWSWRRLPWTRTPNPTTPNPIAYHAPSSADSQYGFSNARPTNGDSSGSYSVLDTRPPIGGIYVWGPPPPYSNPNSPARRAFGQSPARYHHIHHHESHCQMNSSRRTRKDYENTTQVEVQPNEGESTDSSVERTAHTLPARKVKKKTELASVKSVAGSNRTNVQNVFQTEENKPETDEKTDAQCRFLPRLQGVENQAFQKQEGAGQKPETSESEVYFADVSSCCVSVRNDSSLYDEAQPQAEQNEAEDYLAQRIGNLQTTRSRLPFPLPDSDLDFAAIPKDMSQNSLSSVQSPMTETTDDAVTPERPFNQFLAPDAQYEIVQDQSNLTTTISGVSFYNQNNYGYNSPKVQPSPRRSIGSNISALIQNLGGNPAGLLYGEANSADDEEVQGQGCNSDGTMDSGWQSGCEKVSQEQGKTVEASESVKV